MSRLPRIQSARVEHFPIVLIVFDDGLTGEIDHSKVIEKGSMFGPLRDPALFGNVAVSNSGHSYGWNLEDCCNKIDFGAGSARILIESARVTDMASKYRHRLAAAE